MNKRNLEMRTEAARESDRNWRLRNREKVRAQKRKDYAQTKKDPIRYAAYQAYHRAYSKQWEHSREWAWEWSLTHWKWMRVRRRTPLPRVEDMAPLRRTYAEVEQDIVVELGAWAAGRPAHRHSGGA